VNRAMAIREDCKFSDAVVLENSDSHEEEPTRRSSSPPHYDQVST
jgi:hypothetical protein